MSGRSEYHQWGKLQQHEESCSHSLPLNPASAGRFNRYKVSSLPLAQDKRMLKGTPTSSLIFSRLS